MAVDRTAPPIIATRASERFLDPSALVVSYPNRHRVGTAIELRRYTA